MDTSFLHNLTEVKRILDAAHHAASGEALSQDDRAKFMLCHLHRNIFNTAIADVQVLIKTSFPYKYECASTGRIWLELPTAMNKYHMPEDEYTFSSIVGLKNPWSRKFLSPDDSTLQGEFELIVRGNTIIDGSNSATERFRSTYNFGRTISSPRRHKSLDMDPHYLDSSYKMGVCAPQRVEVLDTTEEIKHFHN